MKSPVRRLTEKVVAAKARHEERHRPTSFEFATSSRIQLLHPAAWDSIASGQSFFLSRPFLQLLEDHCPENIRPRYALISHNNTPKAIVVAQVAVLEGERLMKSPDATPSKRASDTKASALRHALVATARRAGKHLEERLLVCGNLLTWGRHGVAFATDADAASLWPAVAEALYRIRRSDKLLGDTSLVLLKDFSAADQPAIEGLRPFSYRPAETDPDMVLTLEPAWRTLNDYLARLDSKYRNAFKQVFRKLEESQVTLEDVQDLRPLSSELHALYLSVQSNAAVRPVTPPASFLPALAQLAGPRFRCTIARKNGVIVGFITSIKDQELAVGYHIGFDRQEASAGTPLYLTLLQTTVRHAIELGCQKLSLGRTALEPKARLGAQPVPLHFWVRHKNPAVNLVLRRFLGFVPHDEAPDRSPFKERPAT